MSVLAADVAASNQSPGGQWSPDEDAPDDARGKEGTLNAVDSTNGNSPCMSADVLSLLMLSITAIRPSV